MEPRTDQDRAKQHVGIAAVERHVRDGMVLGLGSGTTSHWFVRALAGRVRDGLDVVGVPTSLSTLHLAEELQIPLRTLGETERIDVTVDGPDEVDANGYMIKGGGACLLWERMVADASEKMVCVADDTKLVEQLGTFPLPIEVVPYAWESTRRAISRLCAAHGHEDARIELREQYGDPVVTDSGNYILDAHLEAITHPLEIDSQLNWIPGIVENGLFTGIADEVMMASPTGNIQVIDTSDTRPGRIATTPRGRSQNNNRERKI